jgi:hypothetical protein
MSLGNFTNNSNILNSTGKSEESIIIDEKF